MLIFLAVILPLRKNIPVPCPSLDESVFTVKLVPSIFEIVAAPDAPVSSPTSIPIPFPFAI